jgi:hypothetical protein
MRATSNARHADLCICLGSSLSVTPANSLPSRAKEIVIVNLQATDLDDKASIRIWGRSDDFFALLMPEIEKARANEASDRKVEPVDVKVEHGAEAKAAHKKQQSATAKRSKDAAVEVDLVDTGSEPESDEEEWNKELEPKGKKRKGKTPTAKETRNKAKKAKRIVASEEIDLTEG